MSPDYITVEQWSCISTVLRFLWAYWLFIIGFALTLLLAQAIMPSLVFTRQLPMGIMRLRPLLYLGAFGILPIALLFLILAFVNIDVIPEIWGRWWI